MTRVIVGDVSGRRSAIFAPRHFMAWQNNDATSAVIYKQDSRDSNNSRVFFAGQRERAHGRAS
ncbi:hypothetical protein [Hallella colorans]|uniref:hypothetical protein n=1 Tax=Hallella colorans TaxID=1703337 RepID=UPI00055A2E91|nr:hypothetical protein [Hallella colorans]